MATPAPNRLTLENQPVTEGPFRAKGEPVLPVPVQIDNMARLKYIVKTTILHLRETEQVRPNESAKEVAFE